MLKYLLCGLKKQNKPKQTQNQNPQNKKTPSLAPIFITLQHHSLFPYNISLEVLYNILQLIPKTGEH